jgi:hypothetical protein
VGRRDDRHRSRVLLRARPARSGHSAEHARPRLLAPGDAIDVVHERCGAGDARNPATDHRRDQRSCIRRRHVSHARRRLALRGRVGGVLFGRDQQRPHVVGARCDLSAPPRDRDRQRGGDPAHGPQDRCRRSAPRRVGLEGRARRRDRKPRARHRGRDDEAVVLRGDDDQADDVGEPRDQLARGRDRAREPQPAPRGYTGNLDEAIAAFHEKRPAVYKE